MASGGTFSWGNKELTVPPTETHDDAPNAHAKHTDGKREIASRSVTINRPVAEVYAFYRDFSKAPIYMDGIISVEERGKTAHWTSKHGEWDAEITKDVPNEEITWQSEDSSGRAKFEEVAGRGTVLTLTMAYEQGFFEKVLAKLSQTDPDIQARRNLRRLKQLLETGEIATNVRTQRELAEEKN